MVKKRFILLFAMYQAFGLPLTVNFQMVVKDDTGRPVPFNNENISFSMTGDLGINFWSETKPMTSPVGILNTRLGEVTAIDPVSFYAQNNIRLTVRRADGDTIISEPFNTVPFSFRAGFADSSRNAYFLQGKVPEDFLAASFEANIRKSVSDSVAAHPAPDPGQRISDTAGIVQAVLRREIRDTSSAVRGYVVSQNNTLGSGLRKEISDSIAGHPGLDPTGEISDTASSIRNYADNRDDTNKILQRMELRDTLNETRINIRKWIGDSSTIIRQQIRDSLGFRTVSKMFRIGFEYDNQDTAIDIGWGSVYLTVATGIFSSGQSSFSCLFINEAGNCYPIFPAPEGLYRIKKSPFDGSEEDDKITLFYYNGRLYIKNTTANSAELFMQCFYMP